MSYNFSPESANMTYSEFLFTIRNLSNIIDKHGEPIKFYLRMMKYIQGWDVFFDPSIVITEVNNKNMGHLYLGRIRVPVLFSKIVGANNQPAPHVISFVVCKYNELPGVENEEARKERARMIGLKKLSEHYPKRFEGISVEGEMDKQDEFLENIRRFQSGLNDAY
jgi:hypothetical protein